MPGDATVHNKQGNFQDTIFIIGPAYPLRGGIANFNEALCAAYNGQGKHAEIISFTLQYPGFLFPGTTQYAGSDPPPGNMVIHTLINSINPFSWIKTAAYIRKQRPHYILIRYWLPFMAPCLGMIARMVKRGSYKPKVIAICDNVVPHEKRPGDRQLTRFFVGSCDAFVVMSESVKKDLLEFEKHKPIALQPHPVYNTFGEPVEKHVARKNLQLEPGTNYVLFFGFIRNYKGLDILLRAFADERIRRMNVKLLIAGEFYEDKKPYLDIIHQSGISGNVILHDHYIPKERVKDYFGAADIVTQPYRDATQSGVTQIAYHFSKPMIVTRVGGLPEMVPHGVAGYVTEVDPGAVADAIIDFFNHGREMDFVKGVKETAKNFSWESMIEKIETLLRSTSREK